MDIRGRKFTDLHFTKCQLLHSPIAPLIPCEQMSINYSPLTFYELLKRDGIKLQIIPTVVHLSDIFEPVTLYSTFLNTNASMKTLMGHEKGNILTSTSESLGAFPPWN